MGEYLPLFVKMDNIKVLVLGGGSVGTKRALTFRDAGARVTVAAKEFTEELKLSSGLILVPISLPEEMDTLKKLIKEHDLIVVALSDEGLAKEISNFALSEGKLVNNAINYLDGNVIVPLRGRVQGLQIAVTSMGTTSLAARVALSKAIEALESDVEVRAIYEAMGRLKKVIRGTIKDHEVRMKAYEAISIDKEFRELASRGDWVAAYLRGLKIVESFNVAIDPSYYDASNVKLID